MRKRTARILILALALAGLAAVTAAGYYYARINPLIRAGREAGVPSSAKARADVSAFGFETEKGALHTITDYRGKVLVIDVWATWCGTCRRNFPAVVALDRKYLGQEVEVIGLSIDADGWERVRPFLRQNPEMQYTIAVPNPAPSFLLQTIAELKPLGNVSATPTAFVVDRRGHLAGKFVGLGHEQEIDGLVAGLLEE